MNLRVIEYRGVFPFGDTVVSSYADVLPFLCSALVVATTSTIVGICGCIAAVAVVDIFVKEEGDVL